MEPTDIRKQIIIPALKAIDASSLSSEILIYGTGWVESAYKYEEQIGHVINGGLGYWQEEPSDYQDISVWLSYPSKSSLLKKILKASNLNALPGDPRTVESNPTLACLLCRAHYMRTADPLPDPTDAHGMAQYHKTFYNSSQGAANVDRNTRIFQEIIDGIL